MVIRSGEETIGLFLNHVKFEMRVGNDDLDNGDVSMFAKVHALNLTDCKSITDVSTLVNVHQFHVQIDTVTYSIYSYFR
eukprot:m.115891 g.115891  ORF g.115891 m.115891 type:complete len:79 (+) comp9296_c3_seq4:561-797(+)